MGSVWKRLQRVNKRAAKFQFTVSYHDLRLETTAKWRPSNLSVVWTRRSRRVASAPLPWEPDMMNPLVGNISWPVPDNHSISVTLFKDPRTHELEDKDWTFVIEDISMLGKKRVLANANINMRKYASIESTQQSFPLTLKPVSRKITSAVLDLTISCVFLREGKATDEDMQSIVSLMSVNNCDVAPLDDLEDIPDLENSGDISDNLYDFTEQLNMMTTSLNGCIDVPTPISVPSLSEDPTPLAESYNHLNFELEADDRESKAETTDLLPTKNQVVESDESLKTPSASVNPEPVALTTPTKVMAEDKAVLKPQNHDRFHEIRTSTPVEPAPTPTTAATGKVKTNTSSRALNFDKQDVSGVDSNSNSYADQSTAVLSLTPPTITKTSDNSNSSEAVAVAVTNPEPQPKPIKNSSNAAVTAKRSELQPLDLKKSYESTPAVNNMTTNKSATNTSNSLKPVEKILLKDNTPGQDLLEWCKEVTKDYPNVKVTNLTTSWRNGMAFCAIIHHFMPHLIDMSKLSAHDVVGNCRIAFDAAETLGIPRVIEPRDMNLLTVPDKLAVMTYLHQLRAHFTGKQLQIEQIGQTSDESSYVIGNYKSDNLSQNLINFSHLKTQLLHQNSLDDEIINQQQQLSPNSKKDVKNIILTSSKSIIGKVLSPTKEKNSINAMQTNKSSPTIDGSGDTPEDMHQKFVKEPLSPASLDANATNRIITRHKEMSEKAKLMMEKIKISKSNERSDANDEERQQRLREQARRLISETRNKSTGTDSPTSPTKLKRFNYTPERTISPIHNGSGNGGEPYVDVSAKKIAPSWDKVEHTSPSHRLSDANASPLQSFNSVVDRISPKHEKRNDKLTYIESELEALEREQEAIDQKASSLEAKLRAVMGGNPSNNKRGTNPILRLIRNSIGGGDVIRIKLLDPDDDSLFGSGISDTGTEDDEDALSDTCSTSSTEMSQIREGQVIEMQPQRQRPRALSCFVNTNDSCSLMRPTYQQHHHSHERHCHRHRHQQPHHVHHVESYNHLLGTSAPGAASSRQSYCDNLQPYFADDDDAQVMASSGHAAASSRRHRIGGHRHGHHQHRRSRSRGLCETEETEEQLLSQWFTLVNKKNALLRRQMQLNILEQEKDLERKFTMLNQELRAAQSVEDWRKTEVQREKERLLLEELVTIVDKRDQLVQHLHNQEIAIEDDHEIARELEQVDISGGKEKCVIQ
ncbi:EH domain-binding protein 1 isoform X1 [Drosophila albomicans]|uniref:EH domain-binding protein 1 isoform X1 n=1 Tax=Drosophila albomicans TaxID=7291 RepID=A0A9C6WJD3_DROAB|nr:EH domain-binding protein 1 isoform X1 [Drosophila albomicans]XP_051861641.1 EH domain-binding protein 1 isoform X1 [Drosophila albomicans]XP_051861642.1 EH domain-binding protein 1 isoform X1 [Drosophila albomicans]XP_051861643.1 EH domain-binding protein 1 isoform X1 [Drosophila albomicans]